MSHDPVKKGHTTKDREAFVGDNTSGYQDTFLPKTWRDLCGEPYPLNWYKKLFKKHHYTMSAKAIDYWNESRESQFWPTKKRKKYVDDKVRAIVHHAYKTVPYYKKLYDEHGVDINKIKTADDLQKLPLIDKSTLSLGVGELSAEMPFPLDDRLYIKTSGSTGTRMSFTCDREQLDRRWGVWMRLFEWSGWQWNDKEFKFWFKYASTVKKPTVEAFDAFLSNRHFYEFNTLDDIELARFCEEIQSKEPYVITGYWEAIEAIARYAYKNKLSLDVPAILPSTQVVSDTGRRIAEEALGSKILDKYASAEFSGIGHQCERGDLYHIQSENVFLEILKDGKRVRNGLGEAIVTDLSNKSTPLIRYRVGDVLEATEKTCSCPITLPVFKRPHGRTKNVIRTGRRLVTESQLAELEIQLWLEGICDRIKVKQHEDGGIEIEASQVKNMPLLKKKISGLLGIKNPKIKSCKTIDHFRGKRHRGESKVRNPLNN